MNANQCLKMLREMKDVAFATVDSNGNPRVRIIDIMYADEEKVVFCTARGKNFYEELREKPMIGITGMNASYEMVRLHGPVHKMENQKEWIDLIFEENPSMKAVYPGEARYVLEAFCVKEGELEYFNLGVEPIQRYFFSLGEDTSIQEGYEIGDTCIECGTCATVCPQSCIEEGTPYKIIQEHCLHCGLCYEQCPAKAIYKR